MHHVARRPGNPTLDRLEKAAATCRVKSGSEANTELPLPCGWNASRWREVGAGYKAHPGVFRNRCTGYETGSGSCPKRFG